MRVPTMSDEDWDAFLRRRNGLLRALVIILGSIALVTGYIAYDLRRDAKKKDLARVLAVADLKRVAEINDSVSHARHDTLAAHLSRLERILNIHGGFQLDKIKLDTAALIKELYMKQGKQWKEEK